MISVELSVSLQMLLSVVFLHKDNNYSSEKSDDFKNLDRPPGF